jgi:2'-5' RNA ligase
MADDDERVTNLATLDSPVRAFVALKLGDEIESAIAQLIDELRAPDDGVRWVARRNLHLTLKFLGSAVDAAKLPPFARALDAIAARTPPLELRASGTGAFPDLRRPRVVWVGIEGDGLADLARRIEQAAAEFGFERERRPWSGHVTIGRVKHWRGWAHTRGALDRHASSTFGSVHIDSFTLFRSILGNQNSTYEELASFVLRG